MNIFKNITNGYKKIATGIAIVSFLAIVYIALIPGGTLAVSGVFTTAGVGIGSAFVKIVEWPQYNATTAPDGTYSIPAVPYGTYNISAQAPGYTKNKSAITVGSSSVTKDFTLTLGSITGDYRYYAMTDNEIASNKVSTLSDVGTSFTIPQYGDGTAWNTIVYITDASGLGANLTINYYDTNGNPGVIETPTVPINGTYKWIPSDGTNSRPTSGKLVITSNRNIVGEFKIYSATTTDMISSKLYSPADTGTTFTIPQYGDGTAWNTWVAISDVSGIGANLTLKFYDTNGNLIVTETPPSTTIPANGMYSSIVSDGSNGRPRSGKLEITSDHAVTGEYRIFSTGNGGILSNKLYTSADKKNQFTIPQYGDGVAWHTWIAVSDVSGLGANLTIEYYYPNGTLAVTEKPAKISANGMYTTIISDGTNGRPKTGKLTISSDNLVSGEMRIFHLSGRGIMANSLFTQQDISTTLIIPYSGNNVNFGTYLSIADVSGYNTNLRVVYHNLNGAIATTENRPLPADGMIGWVTSDGVSGRPTEGNMFIYTS